MYYDKFIITRRTKKALVLCNYAFSYFISNSAFDKISEMKRRNIKYDYLVPLQNSGNFKEKLYLRRKYVKRF